MSMQSTCCPLFSSLMHKNSTYVIRYVYSCLSYYAQCVCQFRCLSLGMLYNTVLNRYTRNSLKLSACRKLGPEYALTDVHVLTHVHVLNYVHVPTHVHVLIHVHSCTRSYLCTRPH